MNDATEYMCYGKANRTQNRLPERGRISQRLYRFQPIAKTSRTTNKIRLRRIFIALLRSYRLQGTTTMKIRRPHTLTQASCFNIL